MITKQLQFLDEKRFSFKSYVVNIRCIHFLSAIVFTLLSVLNTSMPTFAATYQQIPKMKSGIEKQTDPVSIAPQKNNIVRKSNKFEIADNKKCLTSQEEVLKTNLAICMTGNNCREGLGFTAGSLRLTTEMANQKFALSWSSQRQGIDGVMWQVSKQPFGCTDVNNPKGLVRQGFSNQFATYAKTLRGNFSIDFDSIAQINKYRILSGAHQSTSLPKSKFKLNSAKKGTLISKSKKHNFEIKFPKFYYIRILPVLNSSPLYGSSNIIELIFDDSPPDSNTEIYLPPKKSFPDLYKVDIKNFTPIQFPTMGWGTMRVKGFDEELYQHLLQQSHGIERANLKRLRSQFEQHLNNYSPIILKSYKGKGSEHWLTSLWNAVNSVGDWVSDSYSWAKEQLVELAAQIADALPVVECGSKCKILLKAGLEAGMVALGIPPDLPNAEELLDGGIEYLAAEVASQTGCGSLCTEVIKDQMKRLGEELTIRNKSLTGNEEQAHRNGKEPIHIPEWVDVEMAKEASIQPPRLIIELSRNRQNIANDPDVDLQSYYLQIEFSCKNKNYRKGDKVRVPVDTYYKEGFPVNFMHDWLELKTDPEASLWGAKLIPIPALEPGTKITIPIIPSAVGYLFPGHLDLIRQHNGHIFYDDWPKMYMDGDLTITIKVVGKDLEAISWNEMYRPISKYEKTYKLPNEYRGEYVKRTRIQ